MPRLKKVQYNFPAIDVFDDSLSDNLLTHHVFSTLVPREIDVFARVARGAMTKNIAADLGIAKRTVDLHRHRINKKLRLRTLAEEAILGYRIRTALATWIVTRAFQQRCNGTQRVATSLLTPVDNSIK